MGSRKKKKEKYIGKIYKSRISDIVVYKVLSRVSVRYLFNVLVLDMDNNISEEVYPTYYIKDSIEITDEYYKNLFRLNEIK